MKIEGQARCGLWIAALALGACGSATVEQDGDGDGVAESVEEASGDVGAEDALPPDAPEGETAVDAADDAGTVEDVGGDGAAETEIPAEADGATSDDAVTEAVEDVVPDGPDVPPDGGCDPVHETPSPGGMCDGRGIIACQNWAHDNGGEDAVAVCISAGGGSCARATECTDRSDPSTCRCGVLPACAPGEVCVTYPDASPACKCATGI